MIGALKRSIRLVTLLNLSYFGIEFVLALAIGSVSLFADSVDFLEDALVNLLIFDQVRPPGAPDHAVTTPAAMIATLGSESQP